MVSKATGLSKFCNEDEAFEAGLKEGARRERLALRRWLNSEMNKSETSTWIDGMEVLHKLESSAQRKGKRDGT